MKNKKNILKTTIAVLAIGTAGLLYSFSATPASCCEGQSCNTECCGEVCSCNGNCNPNGCECGCECCK